MAAPLATLARLSLPTLQRKQSVDADNSRRKVRTITSPFFEGGHTTSKQKNLAELNAEKEKIEQQLAQEQHKKQRLENRIAYYECGDRTKRAHNLIVRSADMESIAPLTKLLTRAEFYAFAEMVFDLPEVKGLLMAAVNEHNRAEQKEGC